MITATSWKPSNVVGAILMFLGLVPFVLWMLHIVGVLEAEIGEWPVILMATILFGFGAALRAGNGASIADAALSWIKRGGGHD